jgi:hypothetical protein
VYREASEAEGPLTLFEEVVELVNAQLFYLIFALVVAKQRKHVVGKDVRIGIGAVVPLLVSPFENPKKPSLRTCLPVASLSTS